MMQENWLKNKVKYLPPLFKDLTVKDKPIKTIENTSVTELEMVSYAWPQEDKS